MQAVVLGLAFAASPAGAWETLTGGCAAVGYGFEGSGLECVDVSFESASTALRSGSCTLYGSVVRPLNSGGDALPGALLVSGSGGNNRWEDDGTSRPLLDFAVAAAKRGFAALAYDKRTCSSETYCSAREFCTTVAQNGLKACSACKGCVNIYEITVADFIADGIAAATWLQGYASTSSMTIIGHSQGCTVAPHVAASVGAVNIVTLEGSGTGPGEVLSKQAAFQLPILQAELKYYESTGAADVVETLKGDIQAEMCKINNSWTQIKGISQGNISGYFNTAYKVPAYIPVFGKYVSSATYEKLLAAYGNHTLAQLGITPNTVYCAAELVNTDSGCQCQESYVNVSTSSGRKCNLICERLALLGMGGPSISSVVFYRSWVNLTTTEARVASWKANKGARVLLVNGWTDTKVPGELWGPLHTLVLTEVVSPQYGSAPYSATQPSIYSLGLQSVETIAFANITHMMFDVSDPWASGMTTPYPVRSDVIDGVMDWICRGATVDCSAQGSQGSDSSSEGDKDNITVTTFACSVVGAMVAGGIVGASVMWKVLTKRGRPQPVRRSHFSIAEEYDEEDTASLATPVL